METAWQRLIHEYKSDDVQCTSAVSLLLYYHDDSLSSPLMLLFPNGTRLSLSGGSYCSTLWKFCKIQENFNPKRYSQRMKMNHGPRRHESFILTLDQSKDQSMTQLFVAWYRFSQANTALRVNYPHKISTPATPGDHKAFFEDAVPEFAVEPTVVSLLKQITAWNLIVRFNNFSRVRQL